MNHDYAHCLDYDKGLCPKTCFRAELVKDMDKYKGSGFYVTWSHLKGTEYCKGWRTTISDKRTA